jgi:hypothetical protein
MKNWYFAAFVFFSILFLVAAVFIVSDVQNAMSAFPPERPNDPEILTASAALITAVASLLGSILTFLLSWRQEQRKQNIAQAALARERVALEKEKLALERLRREIEQQEENLTGE